MQSRARHILGRLKGFVLSRPKLTMYVLAYRGLLPPTRANNQIAEFWDSNAIAIHERWGEGTSDFSLMTAILNRYRPVSLLDAGCGSGRFFSLYQQHGVSRAVGTDISGTALEIARHRFPTAEFRQLRVEDLDYAPDTFDLGICNRVLQHLPSSNVRLAVQKLCIACRLVYVNELTQSDALRETFSMRRHDYSLLFEQHGFACLESGGVNRQTYFIFAAPQHAACPP